MLSKGAIEHNEKIHYEISRELIKGNNKLWFSCHFNSTEVDAVYQFIINNSLIEYKMSHCEISNDEFIFIISGFQNYKKLELLELIVKDSLTLRTTYKVKSFNYLLKDIYIPCFKYLNLDYIGEFRFTLNNCNITDCIEILKTITIKKINKLQIVVDITISIEKLCDFLLNMKERINNIKIYIYTNRINFTKKSHEKYIIKEKELKEKYNIEFTFCYNLMHGFPQYNPFSLDNENEK